LAGDLLAVPILLGLGLDEFSMNPPAIPAVKQVISQLTMVQAEAVATAALKLETAEAVRELVKSCSELEQSVFNLPPSPCSD
jgi:phosphoenolpyruvate-protein kinase (PTS system EI component)